MKAPHNVCFQLLSLLDTIQRLFVQKKQKINLDGAKSPSEPQEDEYLPRNLQQALEKFQHEERAWRQNHNLSVALI